MRNATEEEESIKITENKLEYKATETSQTEPYPLELSISDTTRKAPQKTQDSQALLEKEKSRKMSGFPGQRLAGPAPERGPSRLPAAAAARKRLAIDPESIYIEPEAA